MIAVGKVSPQKNYGALLAAWKKAHGKFPEWKVELFGAEKDGGMLRKEIRAAGLEESFLLHPPHAGDHAGVSGLFHLCDVFPL